MTRAKEFHELYARLRIRGQLEYYDARRDEYTRANKQAVVVRNVLLFFAAVSGAATQLVEGAGRAGYAVVGAVLAALAAAVTSYAALVGFPQLEKLYGDAVRNLEEAEVDWYETVPTTDLTAAVERVEGIFRSEIGQWGQLVVKDATQTKADTPDAKRAAPGQVGSNDDFKDPS